jgi:hypothetical protein
VPPLAPRSRRSLALGAVTALISLSLCLCAAEALLRLRYGRVSAITGAPEWRTAEWRGLVYLWDRYHPRHGWTNLPGYRSDERISFRVAINRQGLRGARDYAPRPPPGRRRMAVFGDSLAFGEEVDDDESVPHYLGEQLRGAEVLNFGVHGYGLGQMALRLEDEGFALHPDHVVVMLMLPGNLLRDPQSEFVHPKPAFRLRDGRLSIENLPVPTASNLPWLQRRSFLAAFLLARAHAAADGPESGRHVEVGRLLLRRIQAGAAAEGVPLTLVFTYNARTLQRLAGDRGERERLASVRAALSLPGLDRLDLFDFLARRLAAEGPSLVMPAWHWSPRANCEIAGELAAHLAAARGVWRRRAPPPACPPPRRVAGQRGGAWQ